MVGLGVIWIVEWWHNLWEQLVLNAAKSVTANRPTENENTGRKERISPACDQSNHLFFCEALLLEGGNVVREWLLRLGNTRIVGFHSVNAAESVRNLRTTTAR